MIATSVGSVATAQSARAQPGRRPVRQAPAQKTKDDDAQHVDNDGGEDRQACRSLGQGGDGFRGQGREHGCLREEKPGDPDKAECGQHVAAVGQPTGAIVQVHEDGRQAQHPEGHAEEIQHPVQEVGQEIGHDVGQGRSGQGQGADANEVCQGQGHSPVPNYYHMILYQLI
jgi:hypothetical protein